MSLAYEKITDRIIERLESGVCPWRRPWGHSPDGELVVPRNLQTRKAYHGVNVWTLSAMGYESEWWLTYKQAQSMEGHVCKGEKGTPACFWKIVDDPRCPGCQRQSPRHREDCRRRVVLNGFTVFNLEQIDGVEYPRTERVERPPFDRSSRQLRPSPGAMSPRGAASVRGSRPDGRAATGQASVNADPTVGRTTCR